MSNVGIYMITKIIKKIENLEEVAIKIEEGLMEVIKNTSISYYDAMEFGYYDWDIPSKNIKKIQRDSIKLYQQWYSSAIYLINEHEAKERLIQFNENYEEIINYLQLRTINSENKREFFDNFIDSFDIQRGMLMGIVGIIEIEELNLRKLISADFVEKEIEEAEVLFDKNYIRGAGALAGVALEKHLQSLCELKSINYSKKDTIDPVATKLYTNKVLDVTELKKIQYWASIRNGCDHPHDIDKKEVKKLIEGVKSFIN